jgi:hypothetical protein
MKKIFILSAITMLVSFSAMAQKGEKWIGGGFSYWNNENNEGIKNSSFSFKPEIGFMLSEKWALGGGLIFETSKEEAASEITRKTFGIQPFVRYYFGEAGKFKFFAQGELPFTSTNVENDYGTVSSKYSYSTLGLIARPCIGYKLSEKFSAELLMPQLFAYTSTIGDVDNSSFSFILNKSYSIEDYLLNPTVSFIYKF